MRTLFAKLSAALFGIVLLVGCGFFAIAQLSTTLYYQELTQRLNGSIAMYVTGERTLIENGVVNSEGLRVLAQQAMIINPTVEIYLLDPAGAILAHALPPESVAVDRVDLQPIKALLSGSEPLPVRGTDPRHLNRLKIFSAAEVSGNDGLQGYLYAILGGQQYDTLASSIRGSYVQKLTVGGIAALVLAAFLVGLLVFGLLTRRLTHLTTAVQRFSRADFAAAAAIPPEIGNDDEIGQLGSAFVAMSNKIQEQMQRLKETDRLRRELVSNVSHDLRTPLASMHGYVETLLIKNESLSADERRRYLEITCKHSQRLAQLIGDLFELSKLESASVTPNLESFSLAELLQDVAQEFELEAGRKDVQINITAEPNSATVVADIGLIQRVLENLLRNALKFTPSGGSVTISLANCADGVAVAVADTGCGIADADLVHIFDRFYCSDHGEAGLGGSTGLGLAIVKRILDLHGSRITVTSRVNQGTSFRFDLPTRHAA